MGLRTRVRQLLRGELARRDEVDELRATVASQQARIGELDKRLERVMNALKLATKQASDAAATARQAQQQATTATATAESAADGVSGVEDQLAALIENLG